MKLPGKGYLTFQAYVHFNRLPAEEVRAGLERDGWQFHTITGAAGPSISDKLNVIIHPDGKPLEGFGSPGYVTGSGGGLYVDPKGHKNRMAEFRKALNKRGM